MWCSFCVCLLILSFVLSAPNVPTVLYYILYYLFCLYYRYRNNDKHKNDKMDEIYSPFNGSITKSKLNKVHCNIKSSTHTSLLSDTSITPEIKFSHADIYCQQNQFYLKFYCSNIFRRPFKINRVHIPNKYVSRNYIWR